MASPPSAPSARSISPPSPRSTISSPALHPQIRLARQKQRLLDTRAVQRVFELTGTTAHLPFVDS
jgi:hypothetical protein